MNGADEAINVVKYATEAADGMAAGGPDMAASAMSAAGSIAAHTDFSMIMLFSQASLLVKCVIILLLACSFWTWTIIFAKSSYIKRLKQKGDKFEDDFWHCVSLESFYSGVSDRGDNPFISIFISGMKEWNRSRGRVRSILGARSLLERVENVMRINIAREIEFLEQHISFLATVGSTAPFVGLFGTVWGIMNSFESIGLDQNTSLTSVAPGIAEALFATALGLIVTIPAVVAYNKISGDINKLQGRMDTFVDEFCTILARQLEEDSEQQQSNS